MEQKTERFRTINAYAAMSQFKIISKYVFAIFFVGAGLMHFVDTEFYVSIMPTYLPFHLELVYLSGVAEIVLGVALVVPSFSTLAAWGIIALLIAVFPANIYLYQNQDIWPLWPVIHFLRLPMQFALILWAYSYTRAETPPRATTERSDHQDAEGKTARREEPNLNDADIATDPSDHL